LSHLSGERRPLAGVVAPPPAAILAQTCLEVEEGSKDVFA
jgi:hypothetical protein